MGEDDGQDLDGGGRPKFTDLPDHAGTSGRPVAVTLPAAAELLGQLPAAIQPYTVCSVTSSCAATSRGLRYCPGANGSPHT
jgi:hypothetical protein